VENHRDPAWISIVEDDQAVRNALGNLLESVGLQVEGFSSAEDFVAYNVSNKSSCLILDVRLPGMSGMELQRRLSGDGNPIPIIFITGHTDEALRKRALQDGALAFFLKPFSAQALLETISSTLK